MSAEIHRLRDRACDSEKITINLGPDRDIVIETGKLAHGLHGEGADTAGILAHGGLLRQPVLNVRAHGGHIVSL